MFFKMKGQNNPVCGNAPDTQRILSRSLFVLKVRSMWVPWEMQSNSLCIFNKEEPQM